MITKRIKAFLFDYLLILAYILVLSGLTIGISDYLDIDLNTQRPFGGQLTGFFSLTLPVILYFTLMENSTLGGTFGKKVYRIKVVNENNGKPGFWHLLIRNFIKFLPWELAHFFVFQLFFYLRSYSPTPRSVIAGLVIPQLLALVYFLTMIFQKKNRSIYELLSGTKVIEYAG